MYYKERNKKSQLIKTKSLTSAAFSSSLVLQLC
jgi:hypothetical protein